MSLIHCNRTTLHLKVNQYSLRGLRKQLADKVALQKAFLLTAYVVLADVWAREPFLMLVLVARKISDMLYSILQTWAEARMVMLVSPNTPSFHSVSDAIKHRLKPTSQKDTCIQPRSAFAWAAGFWRHS